MANGPFSFSDWQNWQDNYNRTGGTPTYDVSEEERQEQWSQIKPFFEGLPMGPMPEHFKKTGMSYQQGGAKDISSYLLDLLKKSGQLTGDIGFTRDVETTKEGSDYYSFVEDAASTAPYESSSILNALYNIEGTKFGDLSEEQIKNTIISNLTQPSDALDSSTWTSTGFLGGQSDPYTAEYSDFKWDEDALDKLVSKYRMVQEGHKALDLDALIGGAGKEKAYEERVTKRKTEDLLQNFVRNQASSRYKQFTGAPSLSNRNLTREDYLRALTAYKGEEARNIRGIEDEALGSINDILMDWLGKA